MRAESYDLYNAASTRNAKLFGADKLTKEIVRLDDLDPHDVIIVENGVFQVAPRSHVIGPIGARRSPAKLCKSPAKPYVSYDPLPNDILFGRWKPFQQRPGNFRFREMLDKHMDKYGQGEKGVKSTVTT